MIVDYIGIRDNMREAMKIYGGNTSVAPTRDDVERRPKHSGKNWRSSSSYSPITT